ncbi:hypothetical protein Tco_0344755 [Tanacetum coccineum]
MNIKKDHPNSPRTSLNFDSSCFDDCVTKGGLDQSWRLDSVDINVLRFFETKFPAIVYDDALKLESDLSSKIELNSKLINDVNLENETSLPEYKGNDDDDDKVGVKQFLGVIFVNVNIDTYVDENRKTSHATIILRRLRYGITFRNKRHAWLRFDTQGYTEEDIQEFEARLGKIYDRQVYRVQTLDFNELTEDMDRDITARLQMQHTDAKGHVYGRGDGVECPLCFKEEARSSDVSRLLYCTNGCAFWCDYGAEPWPLTVEARELPTIEIEELIKL